MFRIERAIGPADLTGEAFLRVLARIDDPPGRRVDRAARNPVHHRRSARRARETLPALSDRPFAAARTRTTRRVPAVTTIPILPVVTVRTAG